MVGREADGHTPLSGIADRHRAAQKSCSGSMVLNPAVATTGMRIGREQPKEHPTMLNRPSTEVENAPTEAAVVAPPCAMVIFGAAGDLTKRLVVPALYNLVAARRLPEGFRIVGVDLTDQTVDAWRKGLTDQIKEFVGKDGEFELGRLDQDTWAWLTERMSY